MPLRPRSSVELLDDGVRLVRRDVVPVVVAAALASVPGSIGLAYLTRDDLTGLGEIVDPEVEAGGSDGVEQWQAIGLQVAAGSLSLLVVAAVVAHLTATRRADPTAPVSWWPLARRAPTLLAAWVLVHLVQLLGVLTLGVITVAALVWFVPVTPIVVIEGVGPVAALRRAHALTRRRWWSVAGHVLLVALLTVVLGTAIATVPDELSLAFLGEGAWIGSAAGAVLAGIVTTSVVAGATVALYLDLCVRREGLDLADRLASATREIAA
ncbi:MAG: hypothetical protein AAGF02_19615 [Actinomycetota bacterium]